MTTLCINQPNTDPYFNLAAEEYFLKNFQDDFFMLWRSQTSVVVGKHQNALAEINHEFAKSNQIPVARRLSGGGTVFHDPGNVNFTFIRTVDKISEVNFSVFTVPIVAALKKLEVEAYTTGRNDLLIDGKKISGNAEHVHKNRVLHHGTLLYSSRLDALKGILKVDLSKFEGKAVQSNRSEVTNIADYLSNPISVEAFMNFLFGEICQTYPESQVYELAQEDNDAIEKLSLEKYQTWDWIFGYSPRYRFSNNLQTENGEIRITLDVEKGIIAEAAVTGAIPAELSQKLEKVLMGCKHEFETVKKALTDLNRHRLSVPDFISAMF
jgi:lipoate-protein ligase A